MAVSIREGDVDDIAAAVPLLNAVDRTRVSTVAGARHRLLNAPPEARRNWWAARDGETLVGWGTAGVDYETTARSGYLGAAVLESHRRRGIGTALLERALAHLETRLGSRRARPKRAAASPSGTASGRRTPVACRASIRVQSIPSELDAAEARIASLREVGPEQIFVVDAESVLDEPGDDPIDAVEYEQWVRDYWEHPDLDLELSRAAVVNGQAVAVAYVMVDVESRRALNAYTGSLRAYRGRGFARLAKLGVMRQLAELGIELLLTENDETNAPMLAINNRLGYTPIESRYSYILDR